MDLPRFVTIRRRANGAVQFYWQPAAAARRLGFALKRLADDEATMRDEAARLNAALDAAGGEQPRRGRPKPGTVDELVTAYKSSPFWSDLAPATRVSYDAAFAVIADHFAGVARAAILPHDARRLFDALDANAPAKARLIVRVGRLLWKFGRIKSMAGANPFAELAIKSLERRGKIWPAAAVAAMIDAADRLGLPGVGDAIALGSWLGQRLADLLALPASIITGEITSIQQNKTGAFVTLPDLRLVPDLAGRLTVMRERRQRARVLPMTAIINTATGARYNIDTFKHDFARVRAALAAGEAAAGIVRHAEFQTDFTVKSRRRQPNAFKVATLDLVFRELRHTAVTRLAQAGCSIPEIASISGHTLNSAAAIMETYHQRTAATAAAAFAKRVGFEARNTTATQPTNKS